MAKKVSLKDIAEKVGVSTALVSYVMNGLEKEKRVGKEIVEKINQAAKELHYQPNQIARSLRRGTTNTIGLIVADISNPFFGQLARVIEDEAAKYGYTVVFGSSDESCMKSASLMETLVNRQVDGFIITPTEGCADHINSLIQKEIPLVLMDRFFPELPVNHVVLNNYMATYSAVNHFISKGYRNISMIAYNSSLIHMQERIRGFKDAMKENGLEKDATVKEIRYTHIKYDMEQIIESIVKEKKIHALLFATNALSINGLYAIKKYDIKIPEELGVIGFDGHEAFDFFQPPLTYIEQPLEEMGKESVKILLEQIKGSKKTVHVVLKHKLIERASCG
jgi:LacI family transcriptional regulator